MPGAAASRPMAEWTPERNQLDRVGPDDPDSPVRVLAELDILNAYERIRSCYINMAETLAGRK